MPRFLPALVAALLGCAAVVSAQTTQGLISGRVLDSEDGRPLAAAGITYTSIATNTQGVARTDAAGYYILPLLPPGLYRVRAEAANYQAQELQQLELRVAAFLEINFRLRPRADVWEQGQTRSVFLPGSRSVLTFYGPDVDTTHSTFLEARRLASGGLQSTVSDVIDPLAVRDLPLSGRDVYTALAMQPGVTSDAGTSRGLGLAVNGQRPSASNFLLDGLENNNYLITGPLSTVAPEAVQEYRISTNNFSAEYGRTSGFLANAVTRAGGSRWHGLGYFYTKNDALNANDFQRNLKGLPRTPVRESQPGFSIGGPVHGHTLFASGSFEYLRSRGLQEPQQFSFPTPAFVQFTDSQSSARKLLDQYKPPPSTPDSSVFTGTTTISPPLSVDRYLVLPRVDYIPGGAHRLMTRLAVVRVNRPDFIWTPYKDFVSGLDQNTVSLAVSLSSILRPNLVNEARFGFNTDTLQCGLPVAVLPL